LIDIDAGEAEAQQIIESFQKFMRKASAARKRCAELAAVETWLT
jgi:hypothetical protein